MKKFTIMLACTGMLATAIAQPEPISTDVLIVGGGTGGVSAAMAAARNGRSVIIIEETPWLGGQLTSQGVSAPDEHPWIETVATSSFAAFRRHVRDHYSLGYRLSEKGRAQENLNPGDGWVSQLCYEPIVGVKAINTLLSPAVESGLLTVYTSSKVTSATASQGDVREVLAEVTEPDTGTTRSLLIRPRYVIEATILGDFLEMAEVPYSVGLESQEQTGEEHAYPGDPDPRGVQGFTYCFAVEFRPGEDHTIEKPEMYDFYNDQKRYGIGAFPMFTATAERQWPFWTYRRLISAELFDDHRIPNDIAMINWGSNDYHEKDLIGATPKERERIHYEAKQQSLGFLYWLQTECPREDGNGKGYPEMMLRADIMGTSDGMSMDPYIRESRRIKALTTVYEHDITAKSFKGARSRIYDDSVGIGFYYAIDIHVCVGDPRPLTVKREGPVAPKPFQIPLKSLIPEVGGNVLAGGKNFGVTHVANGAYRMHPTEWNIGEAAGTLAAIALETGKTPTQIAGTTETIRMVQTRLIEQGVPVFWYNDVGPDDPAFEGTQLLALQENWIADPARLEFDPKATFNHDEHTTLTTAIDLPTTATTRADVAKYYIEHLRKSRP